MRVFNLCVKVRAETNRVCAVSGDGDEGGAFITYAMSAMKLTANR